MSYFDVIGGLVKNGANSSICDHVSYLFGITKNVLTILYVVHCIVYSIIYNILSSLRPTNQNTCKIHPIKLLIILHE